MNLILRQVILLLTAPMFRLSVPEVVRFNRSSYPDQDQLLDELDIGPEIMHIYQVLANL